MASPPSLEDAAWTPARLSDERDVRLRIVFVHVQQLLVSSIASASSLTLSSAKRASNMLGHGSLRSPLDVKQLALQIRNSDYSKRVRACVHPAVLLAVLK